MADMQLQLESAAVVPFWTDAVDDEDQRSLLHFATAAGFQLLNSQQYWEVNVAEPAILTSHTLYM